VPRPPASRRRCVLSNTAGCPADRSMSFNSGALLLRFPAAFCHAVSALCFASCGPYVRPATPTRMLLIHSALHCASLPTRLLAPVIPMLPAPVPAPPHRDFTPAPPHSATMPTHPTPSVHFPPPSAISVVWSPGAPVVGVPFVTSWVRYPVHSCLFVPILVGLIRSLIAARSVVLAVCLLPGSVRLAPL